MSDRFAPNSSSVKPVWDTFKNILKGADEDLIKAFLAVAHSKSEIKSVADVQHRLSAMMEMAPGIPWVLYDTIAELMKSFPPALKETLAENIKIETGHTYERLRITTDGHWQIAWEIDPAAEPNNKELALNWYIPPNQTNAPTVPLAIIDCIASSVLLLREDLVLPAATTLSIALEAALWDALEYSGFSRYSDQVTYSSVKWNFKKAFLDKFVVSIEGADKSIKELNTNDGSPFTTTIELRKMQSRESSDVTGIRVEVDKKLADFLVSDQVKEKEHIKDRGFSVAIQKARKERMECLEIVPDFLDNTLISLRNNLVHLPSHGKLDNPIPIEGQSGLQSVDDIRTNPRIVRFLLYKVIDIINTIYTGQMQSIEEETNTKPAQALTNSTIKIDNKSSEKTAIELLNQSPADLRARFEALKTFLLALGKDSQMKALKTYFAFKRSKNFACVEIHPQTKHILAYIKVDPVSIQLERGFTRNVHNIGHYGTGDLEITIRSDEDFERAKDLLTKSYQAN
jgi:predicted transport protein